MGKKVKRREKGEKREKSKGGRIMTKSDIQGGKKILLYPPICIVPTWGENIISYAKTSINKRSELMCRHRLKVRLTD